jgi:hypothetical protein
LNKQFNYHEAKSGSFIITYFLHIPSILAMEIMEHEVNLIFLKGHGSHFGAESPSIKRFHTYE